MQTVSYYRINLPNNFFVNRFDCPIVYFMKKYNFDQSVPSPKREGNREYTVALPENMAIQFCDILQSEEDCVCKFIKTINYYIDDFVDMYVGGCFIKKNGESEVEYFLAKRIPLA